MSNLNFNSTGNGKRSGRTGRALLVAAAGLLLSAGTVLAQDAQTPPADQSSGMSRGRHHHGMPSADDQLKHLTKKLNLTDDQQAKLKPILDDQHTQMEQLRADNSGSREDRWKKMREIRENSDNQIKSVLNEDQQKKFDAMREEQRSRMKERMGAHSGGDAPPTQ
jgi:periplasmic protein CpxP/Spy